MTAWLISALERLPPRARRVVVVVVALLLIGAAITALTIAPSPGTGVRRATPAPRGPARQTTPHPSHPRVAPPVPVAQLQRAHHAAERFLGSYLSFAYGRVRAPAVTPVTPALRNQLVRERAQMTPAERQRHPHVLSLRLVGIMPGFVAATAAVADGGIAMYPLRFTLQRIAGRWSVSSVLEG
jgi:hypothetical protein